MLLGCLEAPEWVGGVPVPVEELDRLAGVVQHVLSRQALRLRDVPAPNAAVTFRIHNARCQCCGSNEKIFESESDYTAYFGSGFGSASTYFCRGIFKKELQPTFFGYTLG